MGVVLKIGVGVCGRLVVRIGVVFVVVVVKVRFVSVRCFIEIF